jgi:predicted small lipoprotein YifL
MAKWRYLGYTVVMALPLALPLCGCGGGEPAEAPPEAIDDTTPPNVDLDMATDEEAATGDESATDEASPEAPAGG